MIGIFYGCVIHLDGGGGAAALRQARLRGGEGGDLLGWRAGHAEYSTVQYSTVQGELDTLGRHQSRVTCHVSLATCGSPGHVHRVRVRGHGAAHAPLRLLEHAVPLGHGGELVADQSLLQLGEHRHVEGAHPRVGLQRLVTSLGVST